MTDSMRERFRGYHKPSNEENEALWRECVFVLDTNVLLNIYRYAASTREDFFRVLRHLKDRLWIPHHVAAEFYKNRLTVIGEQSKKYDELSDRLRKVVGALSDGAFQKSGFLNISDLEAILSPSVEKAEGIIAASRAAHPKLLEEDPYVETLVGIIGNSLGVEPTSQQHTQRGKDAQERIDRQQPPGYEDAKKPAPERYGDVFIWFEILEYAKSTNRPIVFVTDDAKKDWWLETAGEKRGPRPELRQEIKQVANVDFGLYSPALLMRRVGAELGVKVAPASIDDAKEIGEELMERGNREAVGVEPDASIAFATGETVLHVRHRHNFYVNEVVGWFRTSRPGLRIDRTDHRTLMVRGADERVALVEVRRIPGSLDLGLRLIKEFQLRAQAQITQGLVDDAQLFLISRSSALARTFFDGLMRQVRPNPMPGLAVGFIDDNGLRIIGGWEGPARTFLKWGVEG